MGRTEEKFSELCVQFFTKGLEERIYAAALIVVIAPDVELETVLTFASSPDKGKRAGAGVALGVHLHNRPDLAKNEDVKRSLCDGLSDEFSRVRFRFVEALRNSRPLRKVFRDKLQEIANGDENKEVRSEAKEVLKVKKEK